MTKRKRTAIILIVLGGLIALCPLPFLSGFKAGFGLFDNLMAVKVWLIPYRFILALAVLLAFVGIRKIADPAR